MVRHECLRCRFSTWFTTRRGTTYRAAGPCRALQAASSGWYVDKLRTARADKHTHGKRAGELDSGKRKRQKKDCQPRQKTGRFTPHIEHNPQKPPLQQATIVAVTADLAIASAATTTASNTVTVTTTFTAIACYRTLVPLPSEPLPPLPPPLTPPRMATIAPLTRSSVLRIETLPLLTPPLRLLGLQPPQPLLALPLYRYPLPPLVPPPMSSLPPLPLPRYLHYTAPAATSTTSYHNPTAAAANVTAATVSTTASAATIQLLPSLKRPPQTVQLRYCDQCCPATVTATTTVATAAIATITNGAFTTATTEPTVLPLPPSLVFLSLAHTATIPLPTLLSPPALAPPFSLPRRFCDHRRCYCYRGYQPYCDCRCYRRSRLNVGTANISWYRDYRRNRYRAATSAGTAATAFFPTATVPHLPLSNRQRCCRHGDYRRHSYPCCGCHYSFYRCHSSCGCHYCCQY